MFTKRSAIKGVCVRLCVKHDCTQTVALLFSAGWRSHVILFLTPKEHLELERPCNSPGFSRLRLAHPQRWGLTHTNTHTSCTRCMCISISFSYFYRRKNPKNTSIFTYLGHRYGSADIKGAAHNTLTHFKTSYLCFITTCLGFVRGYQLIPSSSHVNMYPS